MTRHETQAIPPEENWRVVRVWLCERIRRRARALQRLSPDAPAPESVDSELAAIGDDATALGRLAERLDRALDVAFAPRAHRVGETESVRPAAKRAPSEEFKVH